MSGQPLARAFRQISGLTGLSRILGFGRDVVFAAFLGAGLAADAFVVALKLPNMFRRLTAEGAMANAFVPAYASMREAGGDTAATSACRRGPDDAVCRPLRACCSWRDLHAGDHIGFGARDLSTHLTGWMPPSRWRG